MSEKKLSIRSHSWGSANISWSVVVEELLHAAEGLGHKSIFLSTNGFNGTKYWNSKRGAEDGFFQHAFIRDGSQFDIDLTYTVPQNFKDRFLKSSKCKMAIYAYESSIMPTSWRQCYSQVDYVLPPSEYCAKMILENGCPTEKIIVVPHGVDTEVFNPNVAPLDLKTDKGFKFLCVAEPHYRKQLDKLLEIYCRTFTAKDDVSFILKTKIFDSPETRKMRAGFEMDIMSVLRNLKVKYGNSMPEIKVVGKRIPNMASLYTACNAFSLMTASEGWGVPYLEALASGLPVIAPRHGGQLAFLNDSNAILTKCGTRRARPQEIYWGGGLNGTVGNPDEADFANAMRNLWFAETIKYKDRSEGASTMAQVEYANKYAARQQAGLETARRLTWSNAMEQIVNIYNGATNARK